METPPDIPSEITEAEKARRVRELNDAFRRSFSSGRVLMTPGIEALGNESLQALLRKIREFEDFTPDNDPHGEHDFGSIQHGNRKVFWKIDYYDPILSMGSEDPSDPAQTTRVLTVMLAEEY